LLYNEAEVYSGELGKGVFISIKGILLAYADLLQRRNGTPPGLHASLLEVVTITV